MMNRRKELQNEYGMKKRVMGVFQIVNTNNGKVYVASSPTLESAWTREEFMLKMGGHMNKALQADWNETGGKGFEFEVLEELKLGDEVRNDYKDIKSADGSGGVRREVIQAYRNDLRQLEDKWLEKLQPYDEKGYNRRRREQ
ncbi:GIY-YIG nuclease family protein [Paenibacillus sp. GCM10027626]|uniref:GIY-YIG nuclease family protein n=1 Tax=Paenibacillus sp. GCM10027626 TaxID=3273411 RepID=UPI003628CDD1